MTQENKELLLKYLCMALPYGVTVQYKGHNTIIKNKVLTGSDLDCNMEYYKPYLRPMLSMTEEECKELGELPATISNISETFPNTPYYIEVARVEQINWLLKNHFDFMGLIPKDLAIEVTKENNPYEN